MALALEFKVEIVVVMAWWGGGMEWCGGVGGDSNSEENQEVGRFGCVIFSRYREFQKLLLIFSLEFTKIPETS